MCEGGDVFIFPSVELIKKANSVIAVGQTCPVCGRRFAKLVLRFSDNCVYVPRHSVP